MNIFLLLFVIAVISMIANSMLVSFTVDESRTPNVMFDKVRPSAGTFVFFAHAGVFLFLLGIFVVELMRGWTFDLVSGFSFVALFFSFWLWMHNSHHTEIGENPLSGVWGLAWYLGWIMVAPSKFVSGFLPWLFDEEGPLFVLFTYLSTWGVTFWFLILAGHLLSMRP